MPLRPHRWNFRFSEEDRAILKQNALAAGYTVIAAYVRAKLGLPEAKRGAPAGEEHWRRKRQQKM